MTGNDVRKIRESLKETQAEFAKRLMYSHQKEISRLESFKKRRIPAPAERRIKTMLKDKAIR